MALNPGTRVGPHEPVTSNVWALDAGPDGSILVSPLERPAELVSYSWRGTRPLGQPVKIASFPELSFLDMVVVLTDGRAVIPAEVSGMTRLLAVERGKVPVPLVNTSEETAAPMTALPGSRIAFAIGPEPETIAVADASNGRISARISPRKGSIQSLAASADGGTIYFAAGGSVWSIAAGAATRPGSAAATGWCGTRRMAGWSFPKAGAVYLLGKTFCNRNQATR